MKEAGEESAQYKMARGDWLTVKARRKLGKTYHVKGSLLYCSILLEHGFLQFLLPKYRRDCSLKSSEASYIDFLVAAVCLRFFIFNKSIWKHVTALSEFLYWKCFLSFW